MPLNLSKYSLLIYWQNTKDALLLKNYI